MNDFYGSFIPTTQVWDVTELFTEVEDPKLRELFIRMYQNLNLMATSVNTKDSAYYVPYEFINGQVFFPPPGTNSATAVAPAFRQDFRILVNFGALPNAGTKSVAHGIKPADINSGWSFTRIYACASDPVNLLYIPIPYASGTLNKNIELSVDNTNVNITTSINYSAYTITYVVLEYLKY